MAFKYINAAISGEYQKILARLIEDPETLNLSDTPTSDLPDDVTQTGDNADGVLTGSLKSIEMDGTDDFLKLPTAQGLGTEILLEGHWLKYSKTWSYCQQYCFRGMDKNRL